MPGESLLTTIAEVSVAFAGFSGLIAIFSSATGHGPRLVDFPQFWFMIEISLATLFFSLLPLLLEQLGAPAELMWACASAAVALFLLLYLFRIFGPQPDLPPERHPPRSLWISAAIGSALLFVLLLLNTASIGVHREAWPYFLALVWLLAGAAVSFFLLLWHLRTAD